MDRFFTDKEYQHVADDFHLGKIRSVTRFKGGLAAPKVCIETEKGKFVVAKYTIGPGDNFKNKPKRSILSEVMFLNRLRGLPVPRPMKNNRGEYLADYRGFGVIVYPFLPGEQPTSMNTKRSCQLGRFLGEFHNRGLRIRPHLYKRIKYYDFPNPKYRKMRPYAYDQKNKELREIVPIVEDIILSCRPKRHLPQGPVHIDLKSDNELFLGDDLAGIIDFGNVYVGPLMLDVGKTIILNCTKNGKVDRELMGSFLRGYEEKRKFTADERRYLIKSIAYGLCATIWLDLYHVPLKLVPAEHTLDYVRKYLDAAIELQESEKKQKT